MHVIVDSGAVAPLDDDGERFPFIVLSPDEQTEIHADSYHDIVGFVIGNGYTDLDETQAEEALSMRHDFAIWLAAQLSRVDEDRPWDVLPLGKEELDDMGIEDEDLISYVVGEGVVYFDDRQFEMPGLYSLAEEIEDGSVLGPSVFGPEYSRMFVPSPLDNGRAWDYTFPFIGVATDYFPTTNVKAPQGNVILIDPLNEKTMVDSLLRVNELLVPLGYKPFIDLYTYEVE